MQVAVYDPDQHLGELLSLLARRLHDQHVGDSADVLRHNGGQHEFEKEVFALLEALTDVVPPYRRGRAHASDWLFPPTAWAW
jgi:hypothetical protein